jgi:hypothetical protein
MPVKIEINLKKDELSQVRYTPRQSEMPSLAT